jgi:hypothetical protein
VWCHGKRSLPADYGVLSTGIKDVVEPDPEETTR